MVGGARDGRMVRSKMDPGEQWRGNRTQCRTCSRSAEEESQTRLARKYHPTHQTQPPQNLTDITHRHTTVTSPRAHLQPILTDSHLQVQLAEGAAPVGTVLHLGGGTAQVASDKLKQT